MKRNVVISSNIKSVGFDNGILEVEFNSGAVYQYADVPKEIFDGIMSAESVGKFVNEKVIRQPFVFKKLTAEEIAKEAVVEEKEKCGAIIQFGDDFGDNHTTFHCMLDKNHTEKHKESGSMYDKYPYVVEWEGDMSGDFGGENK